MKRKYIATIIFFTSITSIFPGTISFFQDLSLTYEIVDNDLNCTLKAKTTGYIGILIPFKSKIKKSNIIIGYIKDGQVILEDRYGTIKRNTTDISIGGTNNLTNISGTETDKETEISFTIPLYSLDKYDVHIPTGRCSFTLFYSDKDDFKAKPIEEVTGGTIIRYPNIYTIDESRLHQKILKAIKSNDIKAAREVLEEKILKIDAEDIENRSPIFFAANLGHLEIVKLLIDYGANINKLSKYNTTALMYAAYNGHYDIVKYLVENGAKIEIKDAYGKTALDYAEYENNKEIIEYLIKQSNK